MTYTISCHDSPAPICPHCGSETVLDAEAVADIEDGDDLSLVCSQCNRLFIVVASRPAAVYSTVASETFTRADMPYAYARGCIERSQPTCVACGKGQAVASPACAHDGELARHVCGHCQNTFLVVVRTRALRYATVDLWPAAARHDLSYLSQTARGQTRHNPS